jgi:cell fate (sporulation/competence/biofilm development) regulator YmcA (YheA/YmcA/DUF963 family)
MNHPVLEWARQFGQRLQNYAEIARFRQAEEQIQRSQTVQQLIATIKKKQKELVHAKHYQKHEYRRQLEKDLAELNKRLEELPIVREYQQAQVEVNDLLQIIQKVLADSISELVQVETGGEVVSGCGSGGMCGCRK